MKATRREQFDLDLLPPDAPDRADVCVDRLISELSGNDGMEHLHVDKASEKEPVELCIVFAQDARAALDGMGGKFTEW